MSNDLTQYYKVRPYLKTGDALFFSGKGNSSEFIKNSTNCPYSHVGFVIRGTQLGNHQERVYILESTTLSNVKDSIDGTYRKGVMAILLSQRLESYNGQCWVFPLARKISDENVKRASDWVWQNHAARIPYEEASGLIKASIHNQNKSKPWWIKLLKVPLSTVFWNPKDEDLKQYFCSELYHKFLEEAKVVEKNTNSSLVLPCDITNLPIFDSKIELI